MPDPDYTIHQCPSCWAKAGKACRRRVWGKTYVDPCAIRVVMTDRTKGCAADRVGVDNSELAVLYMAARRDGVLWKLYKKLIV